MSQVKGVSMEFVYVAVIFALGKGLRRSKRSRMVTAIDKDVTGYITMCLLHICTWNGIKEVKTKPDVDRYR